MDDLSVAVDDQKVWRHAGFRSSTGFGGVRQGNYQVDIAADEGGQRLTGRNYIQCRKGLAYTFVVFGQTADGSPGLSVFTDPKEIAVPPDKVRLRLINAASDLGGVDVLFNNIVGLPNVPVGARSAPLLLDPAPYDLKITAAGGDESLTSPVRIGFHAGRSYTLVLMGRRGAGAGSQSLSLVAYPDAR